MNDDRGTATSLVPLMFPVSTVTILNDRCRLATLTKPLLRIVAAELALNQHGSLGHSLVVHELHQSKTQDNAR